ncbi:MAG: hypothetical protein WB579_15200, partial [Bryobacteraceae bacterium]
LGTRWELRTLVSATDMAVSATAAAITIVSDPASMLPMPLVAALPGTWGTPTTFRVSRTALHVAAASEAALSAAAVSGAASVAAAERSPAAASGVASVVAAVSTGVVVAATAKGPAPMFSRG